MENDNTLAELGEFNERTKEVTSRKLNEAPDAFTKVAICKFLVERGAKGIISTSAVATILGIGARVIKDAERAGKLKAIDKCTYRIEAVINWIYDNPRYISQHHERWEVTEGTSVLICKIINNSWKTLLQYWDFEDLVAEVQYRMMRQKKTECSEGVVITRVLAKIWREMKSRGINKTVSLEAINENREVL